MPWRGPQYEGELPTLGYGVLEWMATYLPSPRDATQPFIPTDEQARDVLQWFTIDQRTGQFIHRRGFLMRAKGWGKSPLAGSIMLAGLGAGSVNDSAPVVFDGWDSSGNPVGRPWGTKGSPPAWVQIAAVSEYQTENTYSSLYQMLTANDHKAAIALRIDDGITRLFLKGRPGRLDKVTSSAGTAEGQPITDALLDETHLWLRTNGGVRMAGTLRRNVAKMNARSLETTNAPIRGMKSVAERTLDAIARGTAGIWADMKRPALEPQPDWSDERMLEAIAYTYGDSWWIEQPRLLAESRDMPWDDVLRFFFNWDRPSEAAAVDPKVWDALIRKVDVPAGTEIGAGFDGSVSRDATVLRGCTRDGFGFTIGKWVRPRGEAMIAWRNAHPGREWVVDRADVDATVERMFATWRVGMMLCDPPKWFTEIDDWAKKYGEKVVLAHDTNQWSKHARSVDRWLTGIREGHHTHDGEEVASAHVKAAHLKTVRVDGAADDGRTMYVLVKGDTTDQIDGAEADVLAYEAALTMPDAPDDSVYERRGMLRLSDLRRPDAKPRSVPGPPVPSGQWSP